MGLNTQLRWTFLILMAACSAAGCEVTKSANPLSPVVAGPIAGVTITKPNLLEPGMDWQIRMRDQPIKLLIQNADTSGQRPLTYTFEISADDSFGTIVYKRTGVPPGADGKTTFQLPDALSAGRNYWWRARAEDGANVGPYSTAVRFAAVMPVTLAAPTLDSPIGVISTIAPVFKFSPGNRSGPVEHITYMVQVANDPGFSSIAAIFIADEALPQTAVDQGYQFLNNKAYYWRVQARDTGDSQAVSPWSSTTFTTAYVAPAPPPPTGGGSIGGGNWQACGSTPGDTLVQCVRDAVYRNSTLEDAFAVTKRVAWLLRGQGAGLLIKNGGENIISWQGYSFSISRIVYSNGALVKVLSDAGEGGGNGATWDTSLFYAGAVDPALYVAPINPDLP